MTEKFRPFAIIEFDELINNKKVVELVPVSWLADDEILTFWPPKNQEHNVPKWTQCQRQPDDTWDTYPIKVISKASK